MLSLKIVLTVILVITHSVTSSGTRLARLNFFGVFYKENCQSGGTIYIYLYTIFTKMYIHICILTRTYQINQNNDLK